MIQRGHVFNGMIIPEEPTALPEGATVQIELIKPETPAGTPARIGGLWKGKVQIAEDFDELPPDLAEAFGMNVK